MIGCTAFQRGAAVLGLCTALVATACGDDGVADAPVPPAGPGPGPSDPRDAGDSGPAGPDPSDAPDEDAGASPGSADAHCENVEQAMFQGEDTIPGEVINSTTEPADYVVTRVVDRFVDGCDTPGLELVFGGGSCNRPRGPELTLRLDVKAIEAQKLGRGQYSLTRERAGGYQPVQVRFRRSDGSVEVPAGEWGTCGEVGGDSFISFTETPGLERRDVYAGSYTMTLPACAGTTADPQTVRGSFSVELGTDYSAVCP